METRKIFGTFIRILVVVGGVVALVTIYPTGSPLAKPVLGISFPLWMVLLEGLLLVLYAGGIITLVSRRYRVLPEEIATQRRISSFLNYLLAITFVIGAFLLLGRVARRGPLVVSSTPTPMPTSITTSTPTPTPAPILTSVAPAEEVTSVVSPTVTLPSEAGVVASLRPTSTPTPKPIIVSKAPWATEITDWEPDTSLLYETSSGFFSWDDEWTSRVDYINGQEVWEYDILAGEPFVMWEDVPTAHWNDPSWGEEHKLDLLTEGRTTGVYKITGEGLFRSEEALRDLQKEILDPQWWSPYSVSLPKGYVTPNQRTRPAVEPPSEDFPYPQIPKWMGVEGTVSYPANGWKEIVPTFQDWEKKGPKLTNWAGSVKILEPEKPPDPYCPGCLPIDVLGQFGTSQGSLVVPDGTVALFWANSDWEVVKAQSTEGGPMWFTSAEAQNSQWFQRLVSGNRPASNPLPRVWHIGRSDIYTVTLTILTSPPLDCGATSITDTTDISLVDDTFLPLVWESSKEAMALAYSGEVRTRIPLGFYHYTLDVDPSATWEEVVYIEGDLFVEDAGGFLRATECEMERRTK